MTAMNRSPVFPAAWPLRHFNADDLLRLVSEYPPRVLELSKDFLDGDVSLKGLARGLERVRGGNSLELVLAGTTDLVRCAGFPWERYRRYLAVQMAQAKFLDCTGFRLLVGPRLPCVEDGTVIDRIETLCEDLSPVQAYVEIHGGIESEPAVLAELLQRAPIMVVIDLQNMQRAGLTSEELRAVLPPERVAYFHVRNLPGVWIEDPASLSEQHESQRRYPGVSFLWEPKTVDEPARIQESFIEYRTAH
jgi:hypothetical protein